MSNKLFNAFIKWLVEEYEYWPAHNAHPMDVDELIQLVRDSLDDEDTTEQQALNCFIDMYDSIAESNVWTHEVHYYGGE